jgi:hypothetical protein
MTPRPDFFIAGAPKCGTTALFEYLSRHPRVFMPAIKEPKFFCPEFKLAGGVYGRDEYVALFASAPAQLVTGEASTLYLYSTTALSRVLAYNPAAKIIVLLRHPVAAAQSLHAARRSHGHENVADFERAWRLQGARQAGEHLPVGWPNPATLQYAAIYSYAAQVRRMFEYVPEGQRHVIIYEEFFADPRRHYAAVLKFLNLDPDRNAVFPVVNPAIGPRWHWVERAMVARPRWLKSVTGPARSALRAAGISSAWIRGMNSVPRQHPALRPAFRAELDAYFAGDIAKLEALLGRPLWRSANAGTAGSAVSNQS